MLPEQDQQETSMRDDLNNAIEDITPAEEFETTSEVTDDAGFSDTSQNDDTDLSNDQDAEKDATSEQSSEMDESADVDKRTESQDGEAAEKGGDEAAVDQDEEQSVSSKDSIKAPVGWSPKARQYWSKLPRDVQEQVAAREKDMAEAMANTKQARQTQDFFDKVSSSYAPVLAAEGVNAFAATQSLFETAAQLRLGSPQQKAQVLAEIINNYGVDIPVLDQVLSGTIQTEPEGDEERIQRMFDERFGPIADAFSQMENGRTEAARTNAENEVTAFAKNAEFLEDVRLDMADLIDLRHNQGRPISLQDAYDACCQANPEIREILAKRADTERLNKAQEELARKKDAGSSLNGRKSGVAPKDSSNTSLREDLEEAMNSSGSA